MARRRRHGDASSWPDSRQVGETTVGRRRRSTVAAGAGTVLPRRHRAVAPRRPDGRTGRRPRGRVEPMPADIRAQAVLLLVGRAAARTDAHRRRHHAARIAVVDGHRARRTRGRRIDAQVLRLDRTASDGSSVHADVRCRCGTAASGGGGQPAARDARGTAAGAAVRDRARGTPADGPSAARSPDRGPLLLQRPARQGRRRRHPYARSGRKVGARPLQLRRSGQPRGDRDRPTAKSRQGRRVGVVAPRVRRARVGVAAIPRRRRQRRHVAGLLEHVLDLRSAGATAGQPLLT